jgi:hypothetical protein
MRIRPWRFTMRGRKDGSQEPDIGDMADPGRHVGAAAQATPHARDGVRVDPEIISASNTTAVAAERPVSAEPERSLPKPQSTPSGRGFHK